MVEYNKQIISEHYDLCGGAKGSVALIITDSKTDQPRPVFGLRGPKLPIGVCGNWQEKGMKRMIAVVNRDECIGCGLCEATCPEVFVLGDDDIAKVIVEVIPNDLEACAQEAKEECPSEAITLE